MDVKTSWKTMTIPELGSTGTVLHIAWGGGAKNAIYSKKPRCALKSKADEQSSHLLMMACMHACLAAAAAACMHATQ